MTASFASEGSMLPIGVDNDRVLSHQEMTTLRRLILGKHGEPGHENESMLSTFCAFMATEVWLADYAEEFDDDVKPESGEINDGKILVDSRQELEGLGRLAAGYALAFRNFATQETWPTDTTRPGYIYDFLERWFDAPNNRLRFSGLPLREYLTQDELWQEPVDG